MGSRLSLLCLYASWRANRRFSRFFINTHTLGFTSRERTLDNIRPRKITVPSCCWLGASALLVTTRDRKPARAVMVVIRFGRPLRLLGDPQALLELLVCHLNDQDAVLGGQFDQDHQAHLGIDVEINRAKHSI